MADNNMEVSKYEDVVVTREQLQPGDQIFTQTSNPTTSSTQTHHGIYIGNDRVVDFGRDQQANRAVQTTLKEFTGERLDTLKKRAYKSATLSGELTVALAMEYCKETVELIFNNEKFNCSDFCWLVKTGITLASQMPFIHGPVNNAMMSINASSPSAGSALSGFFKLSSASIKKS